MFEATQDVLFLEVVSISEEIKVFALPMAQVQSQCRTTHQYVIL
jgi:hypothetical protein